MNIRLASEIQTDSIVNGEGLRTVIWTQGCSHNCAGCQNPETHSFNGGKVYSTEDIIVKISELKNQSGVTLSGGEPFRQPEACYEIAKYVKSIGLNVWAYTGYTFEQILNMAKINPVYLDLLKNIDILVDGKFEKTKKSLNVKFRGSTNQRIINVKKSLAFGMVCIEHKFDGVKECRNMYEKPEYMFV